MTSLRKHTSLSEAILKRLKLIQVVELDIKISKCKLIQNLKKNVDGEVINFSTHLLEPFSQGFSKYKGKVGYKGFIVKKRSRLFDIGKNITVVTGAIKQKDKSLRLTLIFDGFRGVVKLYYALLGIFYLWYLISILGGHSNDISTILIMTILQMIFFIGMPYLIMRRSIRYIRSEILRDLSKLTR